MAQLFRIDWLEQIVQRVGAKGTDSMFVVRRHEHHGRHRFRPDRLDDAEAVELRHLNVEKDDVGFVAMDRVDGVDTRGTLCGDLDLGMLGQQPHELPAAERLVIDDQGAQGCQHDGTGAAVV